MFPYGHFIFILTKGLVMGITLDELPCTPRLYLTFSTLHRVTSRHMFSRPDKSILTIVPHLAVIIPERS